MSRAAWFIRRDNRREAAAMNCRPTFNKFNFKEEKIMKFLSIYKSNKPEGVPPTQKEMEEMGKYVEKMLKSGVVLATEGCLPSALGAKLRLSNGKFTVTDGPFTEAKEIVGGFAVMQANSKAEMIEHVKDFMKLAGDGECEIRQVYDGPEK
jgi:hypothetical protein